MQKRNIFMALCLSIILLGGCAGKSTDPTKGGITSYNPEAYEARIKEREARLTAIEARQAKEREENEELKKAVGEKVLTVAEQQSKLRNMQGDLESMKKQLEKAKATGDTAQKEKIAKAQTRISDMEKIARTSLNHKNTQEREAELAKLQKELAELHKEIDALSVTE